tara:strand:- start:415 stop:630 length:216 start_codon:yes stop_codon:yes gene_type:complete
MITGAGNGPFFFMKVICTKAVMASGQALEAGQSYELSDADGDLLIRMGKAVEGEAPAKPKAKRKPKANAAS